MIHSTLYYFHKINMQENIKKAMQTMHFFFMQSSFQEHLEKAEICIHYVIYMLLGLIYLAFN